MTSSRNVAAHQQGRIGFGALAALLIFVGGLTLAWWLISQPPRVERRPPPPTPPPVVDVISVEERLQAPQLSGFGRVEAAKAIQLASRVAGQLERFEQGVLPGQVVEQGAPLAYIDQADLQLALEDAEAQLTNAQALLALEQAEQQRARSEYESFGRPLSAERRALVLREPQLRQAQAQLTQARVARDQAALNVERATLKAPWRAMVQERLIGAGSVLSQGSDVLSLVGVEQFWVRASLPGETLAWLQPGDAVTLTSQGWPAGASREGRLLSILPNLEENGLQAQLLIAVDDPLALENDALENDALENDALENDALENNAIKNSALENHAPALRLGDVVRLTYHTTATEMLIPLPAAALRPGEQVWWVDEDERLRSTTVALAYRGQEEVLIRSGLAAGQRVVVAGLAQPREGQQVRIRQRGDASAGDQGATQ